MLNANAKIALENPDTPQGVMERRTKEMTGVYAVTNPRTNPHQTASKKMFVPKARTTQISHNHEAT